MNFSKSKCKGIWLHKFDIVEEHHIPNKAVKERCARCGKDIIHVLDQNENADNNEYIKYHMREALVPQHPLFNHEFPYSQYAK